MRIACLASFAAVLLAPASPAETLTVGPIGSGATYLSIQTAVDAAASGDTVTVAAGLYLGFTVNKSLKIVGADRDQVSVLAFPGVSGTPACVDITGLAAGDELFLTGLACGSVLSSNTAPTVHVRDCAGRVVLHDVLLQPDSLAPFPENAQPSVASLRVESSAWVLVDQADIQGASSHWPTADVYRSGPAIDALNSTVWIAGSTIRGGKFGSKVAGNDAPPGTGVQLLDSVLYVADSRVEGGQAFCTQTYIFYSWVTRCTTGAAAIDARGDSLLKLVGGPQAAVFSSGFFCDQQQSCGFVGPNPASVVLSGTSLGIVSEGLPRPSSFALVDAAELNANPMTYPTLRLTAPNGSAGTAFQVLHEGNLIAPFALYAAFDFAAAPLAFAGVDGALALNPATLFAVEALLTDGLGAGFLDVVVPSDPALAGLGIHFQSLELDGATARLSNPATFLVRS